MVSVPGRGGEDNGGDGPWIDVDYSRKKPRGNGVEITFIVQNLPERTTRTILREAFRPFGFISDAYVARKRDKRGNYFGFIRYKGVEDVDATLVVMNTVKILEAKVSVSLAKYDKNHKKFIYTSKVVGEKIWRPKATSGLNPLHNNFAGSRGPMVKEGKSFASLFHNDIPEGNSGSFSCAKSISIAFNGSKYPLHCMGRAIHGVVHDVDSLNTLNAVLTKEGMSNFGVSYIGGLSVLLTLGTPAMVNDAMTNFSTILSKVFSRYHVWKGEDLPLDRVVYLRISGVPVHLRDSSVYEEIGGLFGRVVQESTFSWTDPDNSECSVLVLVPLGKRIEETVVVSWKERRFVVWVAEDIDAWKPDLDDDTLLANNLKEPVDEPDGCPDENNGGDHNMVDEVEEGELRSPEAIGASPGNVTKATTVESAGSPIILENERSVEYEKSENGFGMHVNDGDKHGDGTFPRHSINDDVGPECLAAGKFCGHNGAEERGCNLMDRIDQTGPTPLVGLGKRNRNLRSPPSDGSMQPNRGFCHDPLGDPLFDLNRPSFSTDSRIQDPIGVESDVPTGQFTPDFQPDPGVSNPLQLLF
ncbi:putative RNA recognition motif domain, nucleotide-binding alpha-beta plait domain superfamily [Helianthus annuus]|uniref:RNA recognition motif domain, nucleotide-binding alpha-beta plait domain superfamily n=1 Tax=Helianthus annuus TaxID=4232 RepID=A0A9K3NMN9_HELAN|nr:putative RNA recognition motif domain, nucleotide-binding alpha-beta plait domain superfamily [Helianthus annuus]KAJ0570606.1 putative RNA recognition motif domain, nucleotide-binding alpha-beta plait domain superfamily [Helianthus annuus]KAJ0577487.1 putative RNA recognition motif domain, nucleotide-binding alpha-beta plait domain superfamily [Helianthus annuus]KAJ0584950.1 putative RNA recognition motif domain, nucleotide-binding alpha-beta plait domain superfamily [Helianthus annuus]KAJ07